MILIHDTFAQNCLWSSVLSQCFQSLGHIICIRGSQNFVDCDEMWNVAFPRRGPSCRWLRIYYSRAHRYGGLHLLVQQASSLTIRRFESSVKFQVIFNSQENIVQMVLRFDVGEIVASAVYFTSSITITLVLLITISGLKYHMWNRCLFWSLMSVCYLRYWEWFSEC